MALYFSKEKYIKFCKSVGCDDPIPKWVDECDGKEANILNGFQFGFCSDCIILRDWTIEK